MWLMIPLSGIDVYLSTLSSLFFYVNLKLQLLLIYTLHKSKPACMDGATAAEKNDI